jgi:hypothetical protein
MLDYAEASRAGAQQLFDAIAQLDTFLNRGSLGADTSDAVSKLRHTATSTLIELRTGIEAYSQVKKANLFGTDPSLALQQLQLMKMVEQSKVTFELDVLPNLRLVVRTTIAQNRQTPPDHVDEGELQKVESNSQGWTVERVLDSAEHLAGESERMVGVVSKVMSLAHALGMLVTLVPG